MKLKYAVIPITILFFLIGPSHNAWAFRPCEEDIEKYCNDIAPGRGRVADCLLRNKDHVSQECQQQFDKITLALNELNDACGEDAHEFCRDVRAGRGRTLRCLKENINSLSPACKDKISPPAVPKKN